MYRFFFPDKNTYKCDIKKAEAIDNDLGELFKALFEEPSPGPIKKILSESWEDVGEPLLPITDISTDLANKIRGFYKKIGLFFF